ncbi:hypothetical protein D1605_002630 [Xylella fastidiosa subsp. fastidiosa]|jgi:ElaB/YqjD/DUF883 family membrane-anchored ribosome-binding protein|uniref:Uncharacterized protein n=2 Tax=Xylella fastidiosa TaxID=2371 RepID=Q87E23_XYLFT|nr:hypothetical protein [Xylella fastidiosa]ADN63495.1 hypothetical protein XFLM_07935 [Xylella fastidiosa subsp. fastidiosa GB514]KAF0570851.1 hypothetical protein P305_07695 [Xylella fastidiosa subsp. fastidiosa Mus-1]AAO28379.1 conserved hypothetical protein [Xylella fastidiosa Temecula1]ACB91947.1 conserved hypothetical protein [Xylella fastidiosa M23]EGO83059.1 hypothetical protein XFEB_00062 [Xylella fastidiosa EB92.1]
MNKFTAMTDRALKHTMDLAQQANDRIRRTAPQASQWLKSGAALEVVKSSRKVTGKLIKRNPSIAVAVAAVSVGLAGYMIYRKYKMNHKKKIVINGKGEHMLNEHADHVEVRRSIHRHRSAAAPTDNNSG